MNSKVSMMKSMAVAVALAAGISGIARADDSSMNPFTGDSYAYFNGGNLGHITNPPVFANGPSAWRQSNPNGLTPDQYAALGSEEIAARLNPTVVSRAPADPSWRVTHPNGMTEDEFAALGSEAIAARQLLKQSATSVFASAKGPAYALGAAK